MALPSAFDEKVVDATGDGFVIGNSTSEKVGFYGETPVDQGAAVTTLATTPTATDIATAVNSIISRLQDIGIIA
jgi:hypothetical protein